MQRNKPTVIVADAWMRRVIEALELGSHVRRVVIDATVGEALVIHVERYGDERMLDIIPPAEAVEIVTR